jgi:hypothetical protein
LQSRWCCTATQQANNLRAKLYCFLQVLRHSYEYHGLNELACFA